MHKLAVQLPNHQLINGNILLIAEVVNKLIRLQRVDIRLLVLGIPTAEATTNQFAHRFFVQGSPFDSGSSHGALNLNFTKHPSFMLGHEQPIVDKPSLTLQIFQSGTYFWG